jgi:transposase-like protein
MGKRSELSVAQRREAVLALLRREEPAAKLARRFGVSEQTLHRWRDEFLTAGEAALSGGKNGNGQQRRIAELEKEIEGRDQVIGELTIANRILKKLSGECR